METDVIIVGAGLAGLIAAREIEQAGHSVLLVDKGRSVGGRLATRRLRAGRADHGAQFFTVRSDSFKQQVDQWLSDDLVYIWGYGWSDGSIQEARKDGHPRYVARHGMNQLAQTLATDLNNVQVNTRIETITWDDGRWTVSDDADFSASSRFLILTPPVPQALALLTAVTLADNDRKALERVEYGPCLAGLFVVEGQVYLPEPGAKQNFGQSIYWIADNKEKGISPDERVITIHADVYYSREHFNTSEEKVLHEMAAHLKPHLVDGATIVESQLKKWRYSVPTVSHPDLILKAENLPLIVAGDGFGGYGRFEGAYLSGYMAGQSAKERLK